MKKLGASQVFDYHSLTAIGDIIAALKGKDCADTSAGTAAAEACLEIIDKSGGTEFVAAALCI